MLVKGVTVRKPSARVSCNISWWIPNQHPWLGRNKMIVDHKPVSEGSERSLIYCQWGPIETDIDFSQLWGEMVALVGWFHSIVGQWLCIWCTYIKCDMLLITKRHKLCHMVIWHRQYRQISNVRRTKSQQLNVSRLILQLSSPYPLKPGVKSRMKM